MWQWPHMMRRCQEQGTTLWLNKTKIDTYIKWMMLSSNGQLKETKISSCLSGTAVDPLGSWFTLYAYLYSLSLIKYWFRSWQTLWLTRKNEEEEEEMWGWGRERPSSTLALCVTITMSEFWSVEMRIKRVGGTDKRRENSKTSHNSCLWPSFT